MVALGIHTQFKYYREMKYFNENYQARSKSIQSRPYFDTLLRPPDSSMNKEEWACARRKIVKCCWSTFVSKLEWLFQE